MNTQKIMVVDDEAAITTQLEKRLSVMGYDVVCRASSGEEAIEKAEQYHPDVVLMDIVMPGKLDGIQASEILINTMSIPVIFLTAYISDEFVDRAMLIKPFGYISKPFNMNIIRVTIDGALHYTRIMKMLVEQADRSSMLIREAHHRIKNNLMTVANLISMEAQNSTLDEVKRVYETCIDRINLITRIHEMLTDDTFTDTINLSSYMQNLLEYIFAMYDGSCRGITLHSRIDDININAKQIIPLGLIVSELVTNAAKHAFKDGFPVSETPSVFVGLSMKMDNSFCLEVCDNGKGFPEGFKAGNSGTKGISLIQTLVKQMKAEMVISENNGTSVVISTNPGKETDRE